MRYVFSALIGFILTMLMVLPLQQLSKMREKGSSGLRSRSFGHTFDRGSSPINLAIAPLRGGKIDPREPTIKFLPQYPGEAASKKIEGYVVLSFRVGSDGAVENLKVVESEPPQVFEDSAKQAVSKWVYPAQTGTSSTPIGKGSEQRLRLNFNLKKALAAEISSKPSL